MAIKYAVCDWNGTLFEPSTDEGLNKAIAYERLNDAVSGIKHGKIWKAWDVGKLLVAKRQLKKRLAEYKAGERPLAEVYEPFNRLVVRGMEAEYVFCAMFSYVDRLAEEARKTGRAVVDSRMTFPIRSFHGRTGILSTSQRQAIARMMEKTGLEGVFHYGDIVAHGLDCQDGIARGLTADIYGRKGEVFEDEFLRKRGFVPNETVYAGDTADDLPVADLLPRGHFIVPFYATEEFRELAIGRYGAYAPRDEGILLDFLLKK